MVFFGLRDVDFEDIFEHDRPFSREENSGTSDVMKEEGTVTRQKLVNYEDQRTKQKFFLIPWTHMCM